MANVSKKDLAEKLRSMYKVHDVQCIQLFSFKTAFGGWPRDPIGGRTWKSIARVHSPWGDKPKDAVNLRGIEPRRGPKIAIQ